MVNMVMQNKLAVGGIIVLILIGVWFGLSNSGTPAPVLQQDTPASGVDQELVSTLLTLRAITLSGTIFADPLFKSLKDFGQEIQPEPVGRENPFAPFTPIIRQFDSHPVSVFGPTKK